MNCLDTEILSVSLFYSGPGPDSRAQIRWEPGTRDTEECGWAQHWVMSGIRKISWFWEKYFVCKMKISVDCSQMSDPPGFVDASREKLPGTFDIFTVCNSGVCKRRQKPVGDVQKPQTWNMNCLHRNQNLRLVRMVWKSWVLFYSFIKLRDPVCFIKSNYHSLLGISLLNELTL